MVVVFTRRKQTKVSVRVKIEGGEEVLASRGRLFVVLAACSRAVLLSPLLLSSTLTNFFTAALARVMSFRWSQLTTRVPCERA